MKRSDDTKNKIPCSVAVLTLNSSGTLRRCLDSIKDFAQIVICDGNSTDDTLAIAREYGSTVIKQYDSDEQNMSCVRDKANVRNKALDASHYDWHIYLDSDDVLSPEVVAEIGKIATEERPPCLVYSMPLRIIIGEEKVVKYSSNYPYRQLRLFHKSTGARFRGAVHERIQFDREKYPVGMLQGYYDNHWSVGRLHNIFAYMRSYARWEAEEWKRTSFFSFLKSFFRPLRSAARVLLLSSWNYLRHGFVHSMPLRVEMARLQYQLYLAWLMAKKQFGHVDTQ